MVWNENRAIRMEQNATRLGWNIPDIHKQGIVDMQVSIATDEEATPRERTSAAKCIASMNAQNIAIAVSSNITEANDKLEPVSPAQVVAEMKNTIPSNPDVNP